MATQVRETGGIYSVLNHAHLDELNPTQQEWCDILLLHAHARALHPAFDFGCAASSGVQSHASQVYIRREEPDGELPRKPGGHRRPAPAEQAEFFVKCPASGDSFHARARAQSTRLHARRVLTGARLCPPSVARVTRAAASSGVFGAAEDTAVGASRSASINVSAFSRYKMHRSPLSNGCSRGPSEFGGIVWPAPRRRFLSSVP